MEQNVKIHSLTFVKAEKFIIYINGLEDPNFPKQETFQETGQKQP
jgi:hypothetical protein